MLLTKKDNKKDKRRSLILAGGGMRLANQVGREIPCFNHKIKVQKLRNKTAMETSCNIVYNLEEYTIYASWQLRSALDLLLGLEFKSIEISISKTDVIIMQGTLYQNIRQRMSNLWSTNIRMQDGKSGGTGLKYRMTKN